MKSKKFALIGTSCVGKTTLLFELERLLKKKYKRKKIMIVPEAARYYFEKRKTLKPFSYMHQRNIQEIARDFEERVEKQNPDIIICDRSVLDAVAYVKTMGTKEKTKKLLSKERKWLATYRHFFLLNPEGIRYEMDFIRKEDSETREAFHVSFLSLLQHLNLPYTLVSGNGKQRLKKIEKIISTFKT